MAPVRVAVPDLVSNSYFPAVAAVELGFFQDEGLDATLELLFPVPKTFAALRDGSLDFVAGAAHATLSAFPNWEGAKLLAALARHMYWFLILRSDLGVARNDLSRVRGLRIGAAPGPDAGLRALLIQAGIDLERDGVQIGPIPGTAEAGVSFGVTAAKALEAGLIDGFWANGMGAEVAVRGGIGTMVLDVRRGDGPPGVAGYTFPALVTSDRVIAEQPAWVDGAVRAIVRAQEALRRDPEQATIVGRSLFPPEEASLISTLIQRDLPFYDPVISQDMVTDMNRFAVAAGLLQKEARFEQVVAERAMAHWRQ